MASRGKVLATLRNVIKELRLISKEAGSKNEELETLYRGKGERSTEDSAARVGLKLPKLYES
eukprot:gene3587-4092_t